MLVSIHGNTNSNKNVYTSLDLSIMPVKESTFLRISLLLQLKKLADLLITQKLDILIFTI